MKAVNQPETIYAFSTAPGRAGVAVLRLSGSHVGALIAQWFAGRTLTPRMAHYVAFDDLATGEQIDRGLAIYFPAPHSFTGEDVLECHVHGGQAVKEALLEMLGNRPGFRLAEAGEFTRRAFMAGKMDLMQSEAVADIIAAQTANQRKQAILLLSGNESERFLTTRKSIIHALALLEAYLDFPDEEIPSSVTGQIEEQVTGLRTQIASWLAAPMMAEKIRDGFTISLLGAPNAGKSSLMNALVGRDIAIVSDIAGTTRDRLEIELNIQGYLVRLIDTAGLRESEDRIEQEGVRRAHLAAGEADLKLWLIDLMSDPESYQLLLPLMDDKSLVIWSQSDRYARGFMHPLEPHYPEAIRCSIHEKASLNALIQRLAAWINKQAMATDSPVISRARHREALNECLHHLSLFDMGLPLELAAEQLRRAAIAIGRITGDVSVDDVLDVIFREFCIGK